MARIAKPVAKYLGTQLNLSTSQRAIVNFGVEVLWSGLLSVGITLLAAWLFGVFVEVLYLMLFSAAVKQFAGGAHCSSPGRCAFLTSLTFVVLGKLAILLAFVGQQYLFFFSLFTVLATMTATFLWSPAITREKPFSIEYQKKLRRISFFMSSLTCLLLIVINFYITDSSKVFAAALGMLWFAFAVSPLGYRTIEKADRILVKIFDKGGVKL